MNTRTMNARIEWTARNGRQRSFDVSARRYRDGAFVACLRAPARAGDCIHTVELSPRDVSDTRQLLAATSSQLRASLTQGADARDAVGHAWDIVGYLAEPLPRAARPIARGVPYGWDIVGFLPGLASAIPGAMAGAAGGAVRGAQTGGLEGAARGFVEGFGSATGLASAARGLGDLLAPGAFREPDPATVQGVASGVDAVRRALEAQQAGAREPMRPVYTSAAGAAGGGLAVPAADIIPAVRAEDLRAAAEAALPGVASAARLPPEQAGAALGAAELLARALASLAAETGGRDGAAVADAALVARTALRAVDAYAGSRAGDPRARAAIRDAVNATSSRVARALRVGLALVGE